MDGGRVSWPSLAAALVAVTFVAAGCGQATGGMTAPSMASASGVPVPPAAASAARTIQAGSVTPHALAGWPEPLAVVQTTLRLPTPTTRAVAFPSATGFVIAGGLTATGTTGRVVRVAVDGRPPSTVGRLAHPVHDAGGTELRGTMLLLGGGGATTQDAWVQRVVLDGRGEVRGSLPAARADLAAVVVGSEVVVVGGGASGRADPRVLATSDGVHFRVVANLPIPVRYAAVVAIGSTVIVMGGVSSAGDVSAIQAVDLDRGTAAVASRLPMTMSHATALVLGDVVVVAGGRHRGRPLHSVLEVDPTSFAIREVGHLPYAASDAAGVVVDGVGYLVGGESTRPLATIVKITAR